MQYMLLIYGPEPTAIPLQEAMQTDLDEYNAFTKEVMDRKLMVSSEALHPVATATTVRVRDGKTMTTDGPFAETKEVLGGFYILNCKNLDEAIEMAAKIPGAKNGAIEIRPVFDFSQMS
ncbi:MAG: YciI family protein [Chloroflexota bacterium]|nr:YciI family protein [Anaerolineae bacterium]